MSPKPEPSDAAVLRLADELDAAQTQPSVAILAMTTDTSARIAVRTFCRVLLEVAPDVREELIAIGASPL